MIEINPEDQYAIVSGDTTLEELETALPSGLQYRAPRLPLTLEDWLLSGGLGLLEMPPIRKEVLGLTYTAAHGTVHVGGKVVKNVAGYDAVRLVIGSDASLNRRLRIEQAILRLRPRVPVIRLEQARSETATFSVLRELGAAYAVAYKSENTWILRAEFWGNQPNWGEVISSDLNPTLELHDALGIFPRAKHELSALEARVLNAL
jgi:hypothetical protein